MRGEILFHRTLWLLPTCCGLDHTAKYQISSCRDYCSARARLQMVGNGHQKPGSMTHMGHSVFVRIHALLATWKYFRQVQLRFFLFDIGYTYVGYYHLRIWSLLIFAVSAPLILVSLQTFYVYNQFRRKYRRKYSQIVF